MAEEKAPVVTSPEGRAINISVFERDIYKDERGREGDPMYKIEIAFEGEGDEFEAFEQAAVDAAVLKWGGKGGDMYDADNFKQPFLDGDELAARREAKGKEGDAYKGKLVLRASTKFNKEGNEAEGGIYVAGEDAQELGFAERGQIYNGCLGKVAVKFVAYDAVGDGKDGVTAYLVGFQRSGEGERLTSNAAAGAFKPVGRSEGAAGTGRRRRAG